MKKIILTGFSVLTLVFAGISLAAPSGQIQDAAGDVKLISKTAASKSASAGSAIDPGTMVQTGAKSRAVIRFADGQMVALSSNSTFRLDEYRFDLAKPETSTFAASFLRGAARFVTGLIGDRNHAGWRVDTPLMTAGVRGTELFLGLQNGLYAQVKSGVITMTNSAGTVVVEAGQTALVGSATTLGATIPAGSIPTGMFTELQAISLSAAGGSAAGVSGATIGGVGLPAAAGIAVGVGVAVGVAASGGGSNATTQH